MKFKYFLLFAASILLVDGSPSIAIPRQLAAQPIADSYDNAPGNVQSCQAVKQAVVTIYAGTEIGSGSVINPNGLIITNHHVVKEIVQTAGAKKIYVKLANGNRYIGQLIKTDLRNDLALIKINPQEQLPTVRLASTDTVQAGQKVCAIGSPFGRSGVLSEGTLSRVKSNGDLQSNVRLNPGNSGGPLLNSRGEMIGINKAILESPSGRNTGISFATGVLVARNFIEQSSPSSLGSSIAQAPTPTSVITSQRSIETPAPESNSFLREKAPAPVVTDPNLVIEPSYLATSPAPASPSLQQSTIQKNPNQENSYLEFERPSPGVSPNSQIRQPRPATPTRANLGVTVNVRSLTVQQVQSGSPAATAGLQPGDRLVAVNGDQLTKFADLQAVLNSRPNSATFTVLRSRQLATVRVNF